VTRGLLMIVPLSALAAGACADAPEPEAELHWSYEGETGPDRWGALSSEFALCSTGQAQSPVDLPVTNAAQLDLPDVAFRYQAAVDTVVNNGHTIQVIVPSGSSIEIAGTTYDLLQLHFHAQSEHTLDGAPTPAELHLVHRSAAGGLAVVGVMLVEGAAAPAYDAILDRMPPEEGGRLPTREAVDPTDLLPEDRRTFRYDGSLTTPPCSEGVKWNVIRATQSLSGSQLGKYRALYDGNRRPPMPLNVRGVVFDVR
jgi:carbonic anhydrase